MRKPSESNTNAPTRLRYAIILFAAFSVASLLAFMCRRPFETLTNQVYDSLFRITYYFRHREKISPYIIHVVLDDATIHSLNLPFWDRSIYGRIISIMNSAGAKAIACDIFFQFPGLPENDRVLLQAIANTPRLYFPVLADSRETTADASALIPDDAVLKKILRHPVVKGKGHPEVAHSVYFPFPKLSELTYGLGHINCTPDTDGINRRFPLLYAYQDGYIPSLTLRILADFIEVPDEKIEVEFGRRIVLKQARLPGRQPEDIAIPIDEAGRVLINYTGPWENSFIPFPVKNLLAAESDKAIAAHLFDIVEDSLVFVSNVSTGNKDYGANPFDAVYPLSGIHLTVANMILTRNFASEAGLFEIIAVCLFLILITWLCLVFLPKKCGHFICPAVFILFAVSVIFTAAWFRHFISPVIPGLGILFSFPALFIYDYIIGAKAAAYYKAMAESEHKQALEKKRMLTAIAGSIQTRAGGIEKKPDTVVVSIAQEIGNKEAFSHIETHDPKMYSLFRFIDATVESSRPFLITGESGTGKELFAEAIHKASKRNGTMVRENIAGLDDALFSDTLFGHVKGGFTGAEIVRKGLVEEAKASTLFLDEIGDLSMSSQVKLLRLIERNEYRTIGDDKPRKSEARIICATNQNIPEKIKAKQFRADLYERFTHKIHLPPLREHSADIPLLLHHFINKYSRGQKIDIPGELPGLLMLYHFPGNVRELESMIENALHVDKSAKLSISYFSDYLEKHKDSSLPAFGQTIQDEHGSGDYNSDFLTLEEAEISHIKKALELAGGRQKTAAHLLGISASSLSKKLKGIRKQKPV